MKIAVITRHAVDNYGSVLQAYATQYVLEEMGHDVRIIDYVREDELPQNLDATEVKTKPSWNHPVAKRMLYLLFRKPETLLANRRFALDRNRFLHLTKRYSTIEALHDDCPDADVYLTGSDQVWGLWLMGIRYSLCACVCARRDAACFVWRQLRKTHYARRYMGFVC